jgi:hypothetical protein
LLYPVLLLLFAKSMLPFRSTDIIPCELIPKKT